jgi:hypothetical protein
MQIAYHLGVHCTDEERLLRSLLKNRGVLARDGIAVPGPARYRNLIRETALSLDGRAASKDTQSLVLDQILESEQTFERLILSWENFLAFPPWALRGRLYPTAGRRVQSLAHVFPDHECEFHLAIRNPASFLPALFARLKGKTYADFMQDIHPQDLFWSESITDIAVTNPTIPIHVWCDEDTPLIWPEILSTVSGHRPETQLIDGESLLVSLLSPEGVDHLNERLLETPPENDAAWRAIAAECLDRFGVAAKVDVAVEFPGWTQEMIDVLTFQYDQDLSRIASLPNVLLTLP